VSNAHLSQLLDAADAAEDMLTALGREELVEKAINILNPRQFLVVVERTARRLNRVTRLTEAQARTEVLHELDVDWANLSAAKRAEVIRAASYVYKRAGQEALPKVSEVFRLEAPKLVKDTKKASVRSFKLDIDTSLTLVDKRVAENASSMQTLFARDAYGRRVEEFSEGARDIVSKGLEQGLGRTDIAADLEALSVARGIDRSLSYWRMISSSFSGRARAAAQVAALQEARVQTYRFNAVMDERTSNVCRMLNGTTWSVESAADTLTRTAELTDPEDVVNSQPWISEGKDEDGNPVLYYKKGDRRHYVADVTASAMGRKDEAGEFKARMSNEDMAAAGITVPPLHGHCRSFITMED